jgi:uncharacterized phage protein gp47/JayE
VPDSGERAQVLAYVNARKPLTALVQVITLAEQPITFRIQSLTPDTPAVRSAIELSVTDMFTREGRPGGTIPLSRIDEVISAATGEMSHVLIDPATPVTSYVSQIPVLGTVSYV